MALWLMRSTDGDARLARNPCRAGGIHKRDPPAAARGHGVIAWPLVPLKYLADINRRVLPETTPLETEFRYIDISTCGRGRLEAEPEPMRFEVRLRPFAGDAD